MMINTESVLPPSIDDLERAYTQHGHGLTPAQLSQTRIAIKHLSTALHLFQPRDSDEKPWEKELHISELARIVRTGELLDPILVFPIAGKRWVLDGHCRLEAYQIAGLQTSRLIPVRHFKGIFSDAMLEVSRQNAKDKLKWTKEEKAEAAWRLVKFDERRACYSVRDIAATVKGVSRSTVQNMRTLLTRPVRELGFDPRPLRWSEVKRKRRDLMQCAFDDDWAEKLVKEWALRMRKAFGDKPMAQPAAFFTAMLDAYPQLWRQIEEEAANGEVSRLLCVRSDYEPNNDF